MGVGDEAMLLRNRIPHGFPSSMVRERTVDEENRFALARVDIGEPRMVPSHAAMGVKLGVSVEPRKSRSP
jgi:hypothetical protein